MRTGVQTCSCPICNLPPMAQPSRIIFLTGWIAGCRVTPGGLRLGVNIDHVATIRNARGGSHPDPVRAALTAASAGADGITAHLREDRRHITDADIDRLMGEIDLPLNLEMAATAEMLAIALRHRPHAACIEIGRANV